MNGSLRDLSTSPSIATICRRLVLALSSARPTFRGTSTGATSSSLTTSSTPAGRCVPRSMSSPILDAPRTSPLQCSSTAAAASCRSSRISSARKSRYSPASGWMCSWKTSTAKPPSSSSRNPESTLRDERARQGPAGARVSHERADPPDSGHRRAVQGNQRKVDQESAGPSRVHHCQSFLRELDANADLVRVCREASQRRYGQRRSVGLERLEGRDSRRYGEKPGSHANRHGGYPASGIRSRSVSG